MNIKKALFLLTTSSIFSSPLVNARDLRIPKSALECDSSNGFDNLEFTNQIQQLSDKAPISSALNNKFWDVWLSDEKLEPEQVKDVLLNFRALSEVYINSLALAFIATHDSSFAKNFVEETGDGDPEKEHIKQLDQFILSMADAVGFEISQEDFEKSYFNALPSTQEALDEQEQLYTAVSVNGQGLNRRFFRPKPPEMVVSVRAVSAAHESKAPGMLLKLLEGSVKYLNNENKQNPDIYKYFEEHLGEDMVSRVLKGEKISPSLLQENEIISSYNSDELRAFGMVEQAHRKDSVNSVIKTVESINNECEASIAAKTAVESFKLFLESHGKFWNGLHDHIMREKQHSFVSNYNDEVYSNATNQLSP